MDPVIDDPLPEGLGLDPLPQEAALHVREGDDHGVHAAVLDELSQLLEASRARIARVAPVAHRVPPCVPGPERPPQPFPGNCGNCCGR